MTKYRSIYTIIIGVSVLNLALGEVFLSPEKTESFDEFIFPELADKTPLRNSSLLAALAPSILEDEIEVVIIEQNSFLGGFLPSALSDKAIIKHEVQLGDTVSLIAAQYGVSANSILWSNGLAGKDPIFPGQILSIPPINGVIYAVKPGETVSSLAMKFSAKSSDIIDFNNLTEAGDLKVGEELIVPNAKLGLTGSQAVSIKKLPSISGYFARPTTGRISQGLHPYNAVDIANKCGTSIYATAAGEVIIAKSAGWNGGAGLYVKIQHPNGTATLYAHMSEVLIKAGESVVKGQTIGLIGHTGRTRPKGPAGCHLHFSIYGAKNPLAR